MIADDKFKQEYPISDIHSLEEIDINRELRDEKIKEGVVKKLCYKLEKEEGGLPGLIAKGIDNVLKRVQMQSGDTLNITFNWQFNIPGAELLSMIKDILINEAAQIIISLEGKNV